MILLTYALLVFIFHECSGLITPIKVEEQLLWENDEAEVRMYRCPLITFTPNGNLLVVTEGRKTSGGDASSKFIAARRSEDGGYNWSTERFIYDDGFVVDGDNLGVILVDEINKAIYVFFVLCPHHVDCDISSVMYIKSVDDGITFGKPVNVSAQAEMRDFAPGPGYGIQKKVDPYKGRLIVCGHGGMISVDGVFCLLSDDYGKTWHWGASLYPLPRNGAKVTGDFMPDECQPLELKNGTMIINIRNQNHYHCRCRIIARSDDGLDTIPPINITFDATLLDSAVSASTFIHNDVMYFSNPANSNSRINMTLRWSYDEGNSWSGSLPIWNQASGYSVMTAMPSSIPNIKQQKYLYLVYEKGKLSSTESVSFVKISLDGKL